MTLTKVDEITNKYHSNDSWLVMILQDIQEKYNFLPEAALKRVAENLNIPLSRVYNVATFYSSFSLKPRGRHTVTCCLGTACHVRGGERIVNALSSLLQVEPGDTTEDGLFTLDTVRCLGACALAPVVVIDGKYHSKMTQRKASRLVQGVRSAERRK